MLAIAIELLAGRYTATQFNDRSRPEWPPHPARLYSAMVAAWADSDNPDPGERAALCWLEEQGAPEIHCGAERPRAVVTHFVPVNDATALIPRGAGRSTYALVEGARTALARAEDTGDGKALNRAAAGLVKARAKAVTDAARAGSLTGHETSSVAEGVLEVLPERRGKQGRTYPPEVISGHQDRARSSGPTPPLEKPHLAVIPLLNAGHPQSDGTIYGIAFVLPAECTDEDRAAVEDALRSWAAADRRNTDEFMLRLPAESGSRPVEYALMDRRVRGADLLVDPGRVGILAGVRDALPGLGCAWDCGPYPAARPGQRVAA